MDCSPPGSLSMEFSSQEYWSGLPFPFPGDLPDPAIRSESPAMQAYFFTTELPGKPILFYNSFFFFFDLPIIILLTLLLLQRESVEDVKGRSCTQGDTTSL